MTDQQIGTVNPEKAFVQSTSGKSVTGQSVVTDQGMDKEVVTLHPTAGASSEAPASSGIPSAKAQQGLAGHATAPQDETPMSDHVISTNDRTRI
ncbi:MAG: hypothetical protein ABIY70_06015 [Capsulimonas sp.]|uniref:hypothetical protein n=1 Tax=Capsulimonas sp. TaxID=2494211 RepID=UPI003265ADAD